MFHTVGTISLVWRQTGGVLVTQGEMRENGKDVESVLLRRCFVPSLLVVSCVKAQEIRGLGSKKGTTHARDLTEVRGGV